MDIWKYFVTALVLTLFVPAFGFLMEGLIKFVYSLFARAIGNKATYFLFNRVTFIGVFHHELAHALLATLTGAKVTKIVFFHPEGDRLGYVNYLSRGNFIAQSIQKALASVAPVLCGALSSYGLFVLLTTVSLPIWGIIIGWYCLVSIVVHMTMSSQDFKVMWKGIPVVYLIILGICFVVKINLLAGI